MRPIVFKLNFRELDELVPFVKDGKKHSVHLDIYPGIKVKQPGVHSGTTNGGDFVVCVTDTGAGWKGKQFKHDDLFVDLENKVWASEDNEAIDALMRGYFQVVLGLEPPQIDNPGLPGMSFENFLRAVQALAVAEHRRYEKFEAQLGGKFLPLRFSAGIAEKRWSAGEAIMRQKRGRPGVEELEAKYGIPYITERLFNVVSEDSRIVG